MSRRRAVRQQTGSGALFPPASVRIRCDAAVVPALQRSTVMLRFLLRTFLAAALVANVAAPSVALASEAELRKAAVEILEIERRLAGELDAKSRATWSTERERLEKVARELAHDELESERRSGQHEDEDRIESVGVRVFEGRHAPRERERGTRGERSREESRGRDGERTGGDRRERDEVHAGDGDLEDEEDEEDEEEEEEEEDEDEEEEEEAEEEDLQEEEEEEDQKDESDRDSDLLET